MVDKRIWLDAADEAMDNEFHDKTYEIWGGDIDPHAVEIARHNAELAEVDDTVRFEVDDATRFHWGGQYGRVVTNPPYGERLLEQKEAEELYRAFGRCGGISCRRTWRLFMCSRRTRSLSAASAAQPTKSASSTTVCSSATCSCMGSGSEIKRTPAVRGDAGVNFR